MEFLVSTMHALKLRLLEKVVQARNSAPAVDALANEALEARKMTVCLAVEERICKRIDLAARGDLTEREVMDALCLLLKIVRRTGWPFRFSDAEFLLLMHGREGASGLSRNAEWQTPALRPPTAKRQTPNAEP